MSAALFASSLRGLKTRAIRSGRRTLATTAEEYQAHHEETMQQWKRRTMLGLPFIGLLLGWNYYQHSKHAEHAGHEHKENPKYTYLQIRSKAFPWECKNCGFFELDCWKECRENK